MNFYESSSVNDEIDCPSNDEQYTYDDDSEQEYFEEQEKIKMFEEEEEEKLREEEEEEKLREEEEEKLSKMTEIQKIRYLKHKKFLNENKNNNKNNNDTNNRKVQSNNKKSYEEIFDKLIMKTLNIINKQINNNKPRPIWKSDNYEKTLVSRFPSFFTKGNFYNYPLVLVDDYTLESFSEELCQLSKETIEKTMTSIDEKIHQARKGIIDYAKLRFALFIGEALEYEKNLLKENNDINKKNNKEETEQERKKRLDDDRKKKYM